MSISIDTPVSNGTYVHKSFMKHYPEAYEANRVFWTKKSAKAA